MQEAVRQQIYPCKAVKNLGVKHALVRGSGSMPLGKTLEFRFSESASAGCSHFS